MQGNSPKNSKIVTTLSVAAPAYNEATSIAQVVQSWLSYLKNLSCLKSFEIVVCNDGSNDNTGAILEAMAASNPQLTVIHHKENQGAATALSNAIGNTKYPWVLLIDSDGQYGIDNLKLLIEALEKIGGQAVMGVRTLKHDSIFTRFGSSASGWLCNIFHGTQLRDFNCALKLIDGSILRSLTLEAKGLNYSGEITAKLIERSVKIAEVEVIHKPRLSGRSSAQNLKAAWHRLLFVLYLGFRQFLFRHQVLKIPSDLD